MGHHPPDKTHRVPYLSFALWTAGQLIVAVLTFRFIAPHAFAAELAKPWWIVFWTFLFGIPLSAFEYFYHRYLLHSAVLPFMASMHRAHTTHHGLTSVKAPVRPDNPNTLVEVQNQFPVEEEHQEESMMFPFYSISIFYAIFMVLLALPFKLIFPEAPIVISVIAAVTLQYCGYEMWHAITHLPYDRFWKPFTEGRFGRLGRRIYSFHLMHHWRPSCNLAVVGFWGFAVWDYLFKTHRRPERLPIAGAQVSFSDIELHQPMFMIRVLDRWGGWCHRSSRRVERFLARLFSRRNAPA
jgi:hemolysin III